MDKLVQKFDAQSRKLTDYDKQIIEDMRKEHETMLKIYSNLNREIIVDCLQQKLDDLDKWNKIHPKHKKEELAITFGDIIKNEETGMLEPGEVLMTVVDELFSM